MIQFNPPLSERKLKAVHSLGAGIIEKVKTVRSVQVLLLECLHSLGMFVLQIVLQFPYRFWDSKIQGADYFGHIPPGPDKRGMFSVFYDLDPQVCLFSLTGCKQNI